MRIAIHKDSHIDLNLKSIAENINRLAPSLEVSAGARTINFKGFFILNPTTYQEIPKGVTARHLDATYSIFFTEKPYDNNYFFDSDKNEIIVSLYGWNQLTKIPQNNGAVFFIVALITRYFKIGLSHTKNTGCVNDFWHDKTGVDVGMRSAFICESCRKTSKSSKKLLTELQSILNDLSAASRAETDICDLWKNTTPTKFDVFICHNTEDKEEIRNLCSKLKKRGIKCWLDEEQLPPGRIWQDALEEQLETISTAAVFVGKNGLGPWQQQEIRCFLQEFVHRKCLVIPVVLKSSPEIPKLPLFLRQMTWVDFRKNKPEPISNLIWGITGKQP